MMNRRIAIKQLGLITAGAMLLPGCVKETKSVSVALNNLSITGDQEALLIEVAETIIPATDIPGAKALNLQQFVLRMIDDCQAPEEQKQYEKGLAAFESAVEKQYGKSFVALSAADRKTFLAGLEQTAKAERGKDQLSALSSFYSLTKRYTVQGFTTSEYVMTNALPYNMLPGKFIGCVPITDKNDIKTVIG
jgi:hypothetical protein